MTDLARHLRQLQADVDQLAASRDAARRAVDTAMQEYERRRRYAPAGTATRAAHTAWALAGREWWSAVTAHAAAEDLLRSERRNVDRAADDALLTPTRRRS
ncbi:hypothetical protein [Nonomuraea endophytica]|uniref:hypothetical protein n=1 Tax=Nonomuraea endophytica TaxID=714136 RepID=UPI0037C866F5